MLTLALLGETQVPLTELFGDSVVLTIRLFFVFCLIMVELLNICVIKSGETIIIILSLYRFFKSF